MLVLAVGLSLNLFLMGAPSRFQAGMGVGSSTAESAF